MVSIDQSDWNFIEKKLDAKLKRFKKKLLSLKNITFVNLRSVVTDIFEGFEKGIFGDDWKPSDEENEIENFLNVQVIAEEENLDEYDYLERRVKNMDILNGLKCNKTKHTTNFNFNYYKMQKSIDSKQSFILGIRFKGFWHRLMVFLNICGKYQIYIINLSDLNLNLKGEFEKFIIEKVQSSWDVIKIRMIKNSKGICKWLNYMSKIQDSDYAGFIGNFENMPFKIRGKLLQQIFEIN